MDGHFRLAGGARREQYPLGLHVAVVLHRIVERTSGVEHGYPFVLLIARYDIDSRCFDDTWHMMPLIWWAQNDALGNSIKLQ